MLKEHYQDWCDAVDNMDWDKIAEMQRFIEWNMPTLEAVGKLEHHVTVLQQSDDIGEMQTALSNILGIIFG